MGKADPRSGATSWCELDADALRANVQYLRDRLAEGTRLGVVVKSNGYGHGMVACAREFLEAGADWLVVNALAEACTLRDAGIDAPIYVCGSVLPGQAELAARTAARVVLYDRDAAAALAEAGRRAGKPVRVHLKVETGMNRQGMPPARAVELALWLRDQKGLVLEGLTTHYANVEDTTDPSFGAEQLRLLEETRETIESKGADVPMVHSANSAGTILWPRTHGSLVRAGIAAYGLWPSREMQATVTRHRTDGHTGPLSGLVPALSWRARVVQVKAVDAGATIGYGRTFRAVQGMRVGVLPVGYYEGYDRRLSNQGHVLIHGIRAPVIGRVCMNMSMVDLTHVPEAQAGSVVTLLGRDGEEEVSADMLASWMGTINYEVVTGIHPDQPRFVVRGAAVV